MLPHRIRSLRKPKPGGGYVVDIDGKGFGCEDLYAIGYRTDTEISITKAAKARVVEGRRVIKDWIKADKTVYGVNTGFGSNANVKISDEDLETLQENLIRSHACGVGEPLSLERSRMVMALRINVLCQGYSGIRLENLEKYVKALNEGCVSVIPCQGTVGASGDLAPLSHLCLGLMGEGEMWDPKKPGTIGKASEILKDHGIERVKLKCKEGLALINGTQLITALGAEVVVRGTQLARYADMIGAMSVEALKGTVKAFHPLIHKIRPHRGQNLVAARMRAFLDRKNNCSDIAARVVKDGKVQDAYTLRCIPQVHGIVNDIINETRETIETEMNSGTDNPLIFSKNQVNDTELCTEDCVMSGGNFHGEYPAKRLDLFSIGLNEIAVISERRMERLCNKDLSNGLPAFLVGDAKGGGLNNGFMIGHCTSASMVAENKVLVYPASAGSLPTSAAQEDHVSMGGMSARKAIQVCDNVETSLAIELLGACQGITLRLPMNTTPVLQKVYARVRKGVKKWDNDRYLKPDIDYVKDLLRKDVLWPLVHEAVTVELNKTELIHPLLRHETEHDDVLGKSSPHTKTSNITKTSNKKRKRDQHTSKSNEN